MIKNLIPQRIPPKILADNDLSQFFKDLIAVNTQMHSALNGNLNPVLICTTDNIDVTETGETLLTKIPQNKDFVPLFVVIRPTSFIGGGKSIQAVVSFGSNATFDDFLNSITCAVSSATSFQKQEPANGTELVRQIAEKSFTMKVETPSDADKEIWTVDLFGYFV